MKNSGGVSFPYELTTFDAAFIHSLTLIGTILPRCQIDSWNKWHFPSLKKKKKEITKMPVFTICLITPLRSFAVTF